MSFYRFFFININYYDQYENENFDAQCCYSGRLDNWHIGPHENTINKYGKLTLLLDSENRST